MVDYSEPLFSQNWILYAKFGRCTRQTMSVHTYMSVHTKFDSLRGHPDNSDRKIGVSCCDFCTNLFTAADMSADIFLRQRNLSADFSIFIRQHTSVPVVNRFVEKPQQLTPTFCQQKFLSPDKSDSVTSA